MATTVAPKVLGQSKPAGTSCTDLYTVPANTSAVVSVLIIANPGGTADTARVTVAPAGAADSNAHSVGYDIPIAAGDQIEMLKGVTLATTDKVRVRSAGGFLSFSLFGEEVS